MSDNKRNTNVSEALYELANELSELVLREHQILQDEMTQIRSLVQDAVNNLDDNFRQLSAATIKNSEIVDNAQKDGLIDISTHENLSRIGVQMNQHVSSTIRALQFDDIVQQLSSHSRERICQMQSLFTELTKNLVETNNGSVAAGKEHLQLIQNMMEEINRFRIRLEKENPVKQHSMQAGSIELF